VSVESSLKLSSLEAGTVAGAVAEAVAGVEVWARTGASRTRTDVGTRTPATGVGAEAEAWAEAEAEAETEGVAGAGTGAREEGGVSDLTSSSVILDVFLGCL